MSTLKRKLSLLLTILMIAVSVFGQGTVSYAGGVEGEEGEGAENGTVTETQIVSSWDDEGFYPASFKYVMQNFRIKVTFENGQTEQISYWEKIWGSEYGGFISSFNYPNVFYAYFYDKEGNQVKVSDDYIPLGEYTMKIFKEDVEIFEKDVKFLNPEIGDVTSNEVSFSSNQSKKYEETWYPLTLEGEKTYNFSKKDWNTSSPSCFVSMWKMNEDNTVSRVGEGTSSMYSDLLFQYVMEEQQSFYLVVGETYPENTQSGKVFWNEQRVVQSIDVQPASSYKVWNRDIYEIPMKITYTDGTTELFTDWNTFGVYTGGEFYNSLKAETQNGDEFFLAAYKDGERIDFPTTDGWDAGTFTCEAYSEDNAELQDDFQIEVSSIPTENLELKEGSFDAFGASSGAVYYVCISPESQTLEVTNSGTNQFSTYIYTKNERGLWENRQSTLVSAGGTRQMSLGAQTETLIIVEADKEYRGSIGLYVQGQTASAEVLTTEVDAADLSVWAELPIKVNFVCSDGVTPAGDQTISSWNGNAGNAYARTKYYETIYYTLNSGDTQIAVPVLSDELAEWLAGCDSEEERQAVIEELKYYLGVDSLEIPVGTYTVKIYKNSVNDSNLIGTGTIKVVDKSACTTHAWDGGKITTAATCKDAGVKTYTCTVCKETKTESIAKKAHNYSVATCTEPKKCKVCGTTEGSTVGHSYGDWYTVEVSASTLYERRECTKCDAVETRETKHSIWQQDANGWYFLDASGNRAYSRWIKDSTGWAYAGSDGYRVTNKWIKDSVGWCYVDGNGYMVYNQWVKDSVGYCFVDDNGYMVYNQWCLDSTGWAYAGKDGYRQTNKWIKDSTGWCYVDGSGYMVYNQWVKDSVGYCYVGVTGYMVYNTWVTDANGECYVGSDGYRAANKWVKQGTDWCYLGADGYKVTNKWVKDSVGWCWLDANGYMVYKQWVADSKGLCYVGANGYMATNQWVKDDNGWCYVDKNGYKVTNKWVKDSVGWCYVDGSGYMVYEQWVEDSIGWCYVDESGYMVYKQWIQIEKDYYYVDETGYRVEESWKKIGSKEYYFNEDGVMATEEWIGDYYVGADGAWIPDAKR